MSTASQGSVSIDYLGWVPSLQDAVDAWNKGHGDIKVNLQTTSGSVDANTKIRAGVGAGNAPCLSQMAYSDIPSFVADNLLEPVTAEAAAYKNKFLPWTWNLVSPGGQTYGVPQDTGPMVMFYRVDLFKKYGIAVPTTWTQYADDAKKVHAADPTVALGFFGVDDAGNYAGFAAQNDARWYTINGDKWNIGINSSGSTKVATFWQNLITSGEVVATKRYDAGLYPLLEKGKILSLTGAAWNSGLFTQNLADQAGKWAVAPMPNWGTPSSANSGGSAVVVLKGCAHKAEAVKFAAWLNNDEASLNVLSDPARGGLYPASVAALNYKVVNRPVAYFGNQNIYQVFSASAKLVNTSWAWGPTWTSTYTELSDGFTGVAAGSTTIQAVQDKVQQETLDDMAKLGISASGS